MIEEAKDKDARLVCFPELALVSYSTFAEDGITARMRSFVEQGQIAGTVTLVSRHGNVVHFDAVGHADIENNRPMRKNSIFAIASMTKPFTATAVMILQVDGLLSVDDPVSKYPPRFKDAHLVSGPPKTELTIRHLMTHTSGIARLPRTSLLEK